MTADAHYGDIGTAIVVAITEDSVISDISAATLKRKVRANLTFPTRIWSFSVDTFQVDSNLV